jgi:uncharacterized protein YjbJ (UPF0337 family)
MTEADDDLRERGTGNDVEGNMKELGGKAQKGLGDLTDNESMENKGRMHEMEGQAQQGLGNVERGTGNAIDNMDDDSLDDDSLDDDQL